jgi:hypothetical protein
MNTPLINISILSIYKKNDSRVNLPGRMAKCTPDNYNAINRIKTKLEAKGGKLYLSDLFRSYDMQLQAHLDWKTKKKTAYSPPPGGSLHESGRAFDLDLSAIKIPLKDFWALAALEGITPIISKPDTKLTEAWHFDCRGSHEKVYLYYKNKFGSNFESPYAAMATSAILAIGQEVDYFSGKQFEANVQAGLIRLGHTIGNIDGNIGEKTRKALIALGIEQGTLADTSKALEGLLQQKYPSEYSIQQFVDIESNNDLNIPGHIVV